MSKHGLTFHQYVPALGWAFMIAWMSILGMFWHLIIRDGLPGQFAPDLEILIMAFFSIAGISVSAYVFSLPCISLRVEGNKITIKKIWFFQTRTLSGRLQDIPLARLVKDNDSDGDPYYQAVIKIEDEGDIPFFQSSSKEDAEKAVEQLNERINAYKA